MAEMLSSFKRFMLLATLPAALAVGCGSSTNSTKTHDTTTHKGASGASGHYHVGEHCQQSLAFAYKAQGFTCVNGTLRHKSSDKGPATVHHHSPLTTTGAPQGY